MDGLVTNWRAGVYGSQSFHSLLGKHKQVDAGAVVLEVFEVVVMVVRVAVVEVLVT